LLKVDDNGVIITYEAYNYKVTTHAETVLYPVEDITQPVSAYS
jgi:hypothetical protein